MDRKADDSSKRTTKEEHKRSVRTAPRSLVEMIREILVEELAKVQTE